MVLCDYLLSTISRVRHSGDLMHCRICIVPVSIDKVEESSKSVEHVCLLEPRVDEGTLFKLVVGE